MRDTATTDALRGASKNLAQCVRKITPTPSRAALSPSQYEALIGTGIALDWIGWARGLTSITYINPKRGSFERAYATGELTRFTFMWTAANALFSRESVPKLIDPLSSARVSELERFRILFNHAALQDTDTTLWIKNLHAILSLPMHVRHFPWKAVNSPPTVLEVIYFKYTVANEQTRALGKSSITQRAYQTTWPWTFQLSSTPHATGISTECCSPALSEGP
jgi:hypothetical protein